MLSSVSIVSVVSSKEISISRGGSSGVSSAGASCAGESDISTPKSLASIKSSREISSVPPDDSAGAGAGSVCASGPFPGSYPLLPLATESSENPSSRKSSSDISSSPGERGVSAVFFSCVSAAGSSIESKLISSKSAFVSGVSVLISRLSIEAGASVSISEIPSKAESSVVEFSVAGASGILISGSSISEAVSISGMSKVSSSGISVSSGTLLSSGKSWRITSSDAESFESSSPFANRFVSSTSADGVSGASNSESFLNISEKSVLSNSGKSKESSVFSWVSAISSGV